MDRASLYEYGIDYDKGLVNCMGDADFYRTLLNMFLDDDCFSRARAAYAKRDYAELFNCMHELKGVSGNAALSELYSAVFPIVELLRKNEYSDAEIDRMFAHADGVYERACEGIRKLAVK